MSSRIFLTTVLGLSLATASMAGAATMDASKPGATKTDAVKTSTVATPAAAKAPGKVEANKTESSKAASPKLISTKGSASTGLAAGPRAGAAKRLRTSVLHRPHLRIVHRAIKRVRIARAGRHLVVSHHAKRGTVHHA